jgi:hypothetical protein
VAECKNHSQWYLGGDFVWCEKCGAVHRVIAVDDLNKEVTLIGDWVKPQKGLSQLKFRQLTQVDIMPDMGCVIPMSKLLN